MTVSTGDDKEGKPNTVWCVGYRTAVVKNGFCLVTEGLENMDEAVAVAKRMNRENPFSDHIGWA